MTKVNFKTINGNKYISHPFKKIYYFTHPLLSFFTEHGEFYEDCEYIDSEIVIEGVQYSCEEAKYYYLKYKYLLKQHMFETIKREERYICRINSKNIIDEISNLRNIVFEITENCNLNCVYCGYGELYNSNRLGTKNKSVISFPIITSVMNFLIPFWKSENNKSEFQTINIGFYGGEPLLYFDLIKQTVDYIKTLNLTNRGFVFNMTTNGILLDRYMAFLTSNEFNLSVSIDGDKYNHSYRINSKSENSFDKVYNNLKLLQKKYPTYFKQNVEFISVIHDRNTLTSASEFLLKEFGKLPNTYPLNTSRVSAENKVLFDNMFNNINIERVDERLLDLKFIGIPSIRNLSDFLIFNSNLFYQNYSELLNYKSNLTGIKIPTGTCLPFSRKLFVTAGGKILCCEKISQEYEYGYVDDKGVHIDFTSVVEKYNGYIDNVRNSCMNCFYSEFCFQCVYQLEKDENGFLDCQVMSENAYKQYISGIFSFIEDHPNYINRIYEEVVLF